MKENIKDLLDEEIIAQIKNLKMLDDGSEKKQSAIDDLSKLYHLKIEEAKLAEENDVRNCDEQFKEEQLKEQTKDRYFKAGIAAAEIIIPIIFYSVWLKKGFKFEENGIFTSTTFRSLWSKFRPRK